MNKKIFLVLLSATLIFYLPIIFNPSLVLNRRNDLEEFFWPIFYFVKEQIITNHQIPFWNNLWLSGIPLLPNPQVAFFYPPNWSFLIFPIDSAFIINFIFHTLLGSLGIYFTSRLTLKLSDKASLFASLLYIFTPKLSGYLEAGHLGLTQSMAWIPFTIMSVLMLAKTTELGWAILLSVSLAGLFSTHTVIFILIILSSTILYTILLIINFSEKKIVKQSCIFLVSLVGTFGLTAVTLLPQIEWSKFTTRFLLLSTRDVYPKWISIWEFLKNIFIPSIGGFDNLWQIDSEKWLALGLGISILALIGFLRLSLKIKILVSMAILFIILISLNNASPLYSLLLKQDWYVLMRVSTRVWILMILIVIFLAGFGLDNLINKSSKFIVYILITFSFLELIFLSWGYLLKPTNKPNFAPKEVLQFLVSDHDKFRIYCTTRCISQKDAAENNLELLDGYDTVQQLNFYKQSWQLMGAYWNYYTLSIPPMGTYTFDKPQPDSRSLGDFNTKYIISPYPLTSENFMLVKQFGEYKIYRNNLLLPRAYFWTDTQKPSSPAPILKYLPNYIKVDTSFQSTNHLVLSEVYSPEWEAYLDGKEKVPVQQKPDTLRLVDIKKNTKFVDFKYQPKSFQVGLMVTLATWIIISFTLKKWTR